MPRALVFITAVLAAIAVDSQARATSCIDPPHNLVGPVDAVSTADGFVLAWGFSQVDGTAGVKVRRLDPEGRPIGAAQTHVIDAPRTLALGMSDGQPILAVVGGFEDAGDVRVGPAMGTEPLPAVQLPRGKVQLAQIAFTASGVLVRAGIETSQNYFSTAFVAVDMNGALVKRTDQKELPYGDSTAGWIEHEWSAFVPFGDGAAIVADFLGSRLAVRRSSADGGTLFCGAAECGSNAPTPPYPPSWERRSSYSTWVRAVEVDGSLLVLAGAEDGIDVTRVALDGTVTPLPSLAVPITTHYSGGFRYVAPVELRRGADGIVLEAVSGESRDAPWSARLTNAGQLAAEPDKNPEQKPRLACGHGRCISFERQRDTLVVHALTPAATIASTNVLDEMPRVDAPECTTGCGGIGCVVSGSRTGSTCGWLVALAAVACGVARRRGRQAPATM